ncbi:132aa long hypothetical protein [Pyrococcus horikoshii OT3]|uniref:Uncharacterized protein n=1 Tax=Pyrococcus horikoshii (strain ATCC 700860 / DSM 12428 / JCM 9974 / NBRC 100139 / OT-3) TaxID=70601 RepID=O58130_PYRHO|nr:132aa long hypothetical protein [Pyrococcus horikoshii OT3]
MTPLLVIASLNLTILPLYMNSAIKLLPTLNLSFSITSPMYLSSEGLKGMPSRMTLPFLTLMLLKCLNTSHTYTKSLMKYFEGSSISIICPFLHSRRFTLLRYLNRSSVIRGLLIRDDISSKMFNIEFISHHP